MKLESNDWRMKTQELLDQYGVLFQKQLYDLLIKNGYQISYQKFNDYLRSTLLFYRTRLFGSSNALIVMIRGTNRSRLKCLDMILVNSYLIENDLRPVFAHDSDFLRGIKILVSKLRKEKALTEEQKDEMKVQQDLYESFILSRNALLQGYDIESQKDQTLFNSLYSRGIHFRTATKNGLEFILTDKHNTLSVSKIVQAVVDLQEQYEERMQIPIKICLDVVCISEKKREKLQKQFDHDFDELYLKEKIKRRVVFFKDPTVKIHVSDMEKYVSNIDRYIIA